MRVFPRKSAQHSTVRLSSRWSFATWVSSVMAVRFITSFCLTMARAKAQSVSCRSWGRDRPRAFSPSFSVFSIIRDSPLR